MIVSVSLGAVGRDCGLAVLNSGGRRDYGSTRGRALQDAFTDGGAAVPPPHLSIPHGTDCGLAVFDLQTLLKPDTIIERSPPPTASQALLKPCLYGGRAGIVGSQLKKFFVVLSRRIRLLKILRV